MSDHEQTLEEYWKKRAEKAEADRNRMMLDLDSLQCDVASALGWDCGGVVFAKLVRGYVMAHAIERAEVERLREEVRNLEAELKAIFRGPSWPSEDTLAPREGQESEEGGR